jgi:hypothetical protein
VVEVLALSVPLIFMSQIAGVVCDALALLRPKLIIQASGLAAIAALILALYPSGLRAIAWAIVIGESLRFAAVVTLLSRELECAPADVGRVLASVVTTSALAYGACSGAAALADGWQLGPFPSLGLDILAGLLALALGASLALRLMDGTAPAQLAEASLPGWKRLRARLGLSGAWA